MKGLRILLAAAILAVTLVGAVAPKNVEAASREVSEPGCWLINQLRKLENLKQADGTYRVPRYGSPDYSNFLKMLAGGTKDYQVTHGLTSLLDAGFAGPNTDHFVVRDPGPHKCPPPGAPAAGRGNGPSPAPLGSSTGVFVAALLGLLGAVGLLGRRGLLPSRPLVS